MFSFTEELQSEDTPESVHMQVQRRHIGVGDWLIDVHVYVDVVLLWACVHITPLHPYTPTHPPTHSGTTRSWSAAAARPSSRTPRPRPVGMLCVDRCWHVGGCLP